MRHPEQREGFSQVLLDSSFHCVSFRMTSVKFRILMCKREVYGKCFNA